MVRVRIDGNHDPIWPARAPAAAPYVPKRAFPESGRAEAPAHPGSEGGYAARGTARALASTVASRARIVRSTWSRTRAIRLVRRGSMAHSCFNRPNSRSTEPGWRYRSPHRSMDRGTSVWSRGSLHPHRTGLALAGRAAPLGRRIAVACLTAAPRPREALPRAAAAH